MNIITSGTRSIVALAIAGVAVAGCSSPMPAMSSMPSAPPTSPATGAPSASRNDADITFAQGMIVHHQQAVEMARLAAGRSQNTQVLDLATRIGAAQTPEIQTMTGWLEKWGQMPPATGSMPGMNHAPTSGTDSVSGSMTTEQMQQLTQASGVAFDRMFLEMMIEHHQGAITMSQTEVTSGSDVDAKKLAQNIITAQQTEIGEMDTLLTRL
ncbi:DUF305 domain-containing protein [Pseudonocardia sp. GCM10023141]|uniref:DUF305 domain-containing protein n=1 Tax=Pseudonocardia sp. GCM10023141 TaxID=3252653 RepID=UPI003615D2C6